MSETGIAAGNARIPDAAHILKRAGVAARAWDASDEKGIDLENFGATEQGGASSSVTIDGRGHGRSQVPQSPDEGEAMIAEVDAKYADIPHPGMTDEQAANLARYSRHLFGVQRPVRRLAPKTGAHSVPRARGPARLPTGAILGAISPVSHGSYWLKTKPPADRGFLL